MLQFVTWSLLSIQRSGEVFCSRGQLRELVVPNISLVTLSKRGWHSVETTVQQSGCKGEAQTPGTDAELASLSSAEPPCSQDPAP